jgi:hypothetical protein
MQSSNRLPLSICKPSLRHRATLCRHSVSKPETLRCCSKSELLSQRNSPGNGPARHQRASIAEESIHTRVLPISPTPLLLKTRLNGWLRAPMSNSRFAVAEISELCCCKKRARDRFKTRQRCRKLKGFWHRKILSMIPVLFPSKTLLIMHQTSFYRESQISWCRKIRTGNPSKPSRCNGLRAPNLRQLSKDEWLECNLRKADE